MKMHMKNVVCEMAAILFRGGGGGGGWVGGGGGGGGGGGVVVVVVGVVELKPSTRNSFKSWWPLISPLAEIRAFYILIIKPTMSRKP